MGDFIIDNQAEDYTEKLSSCIKENMIMVVSLIDMHVDQVEDQKAANLVNQLRNRVKALMLIQERITDDLKQVDFKGYLQDLVFYLFQNGSVCHYDLQVEEVFLDVDVAIRCGLMINELISNALQHAFIPGVLSQDTPVISIGFSRYEQVYQVVVKDNGSGLVFDEDWRNASNLGLQIVDWLAQQLNADVKVCNQAGTEFIVKFWVESV